MLYVVYTYETVNGQLECHIYSGEPNTATWTQQEANMELQALQAKNPGLSGMVLPIEQVPA